MSETGAGDEMIARAQKMQMRRGFFFGGRGEQRSQLSALCSFDVDNVSVVKTSSKSHLIKAAYVAPHEAPLESHDSKYGNEMLPTWRNTEKDILSVITLHILCGECYIEVNTLNRTRSNLSHTFQSFIDAFESSE